MDNMTIPILVATGAFDPPSGGHGQRLDPLDFGLAILAGVLVFLALQAHDRWKNKK